MGSIHEWPHPPDDATPAAPHRPASSKQGALHEVSRHVQLDLGRGHTGVVEDFVKRHHDGVKLGARKRVAPREPLLGGALGVADAVAVSSTRVRHVGARGNCLRPQCCSRRELSGPWNVHRTHRSRDCGGRRGGGRRRHDPRDCSHCRKCTAELLRQTFAGGGSTNRAAQASILDTRVSRSFLPGSCPLTSPDTRVSGSFANLL